MRRRTPNPHALGSQDASKRKPLSWRIQDARRRSSIPRFKAPSFAGWCCTGARSSRSPALVAFCLQVLSNPFRSIREHAQHVWWTHGPFLLVMFFMLPVFIVDTIKLSHRFAGPIYRLRQTIRSLAHGERVPPA